PATHHFDFASTASHRGKVQPPDTRNNLEEPLLAGAHLFRRPCFGRTDLARDDGHIALRMLKVDGLLAKEVLIARPIVLVPPDEDKVAQGLGQQLALLIVREPLTPKAVAARALWQDVLNGPVDRIEVLRLPGQLIVEAKQDEFARLRMTLVQVAEIVRDMPLLVAGEQAG